MKFVLNGRFYGQPVTGVQRYARSLADFELGLTGSDIRVAVPGSGLVSLDQAPRTAVSRGKRFGHAWEQLRLPKLVGADDILVGLGNYGPRRMRNQVLTLHDAASAIVPDSFSRAHHMLFSRFGVAAARNAAAVITHSETSRRDLVDRYHLEPDRVHVVPCGVGPEFYPGFPHKAERPYCLFVGAHDPRKNLAFLEDIWPAVERRTGLALIATARSSSAAHAEIPVADVEIRYDVTDAELRDLYQGAELVLQPSSYEGFGLPILEGAACGTPFLSTDVGAAPELASDPARQVLPLDRAAWVDAITAHCGLPAADRDVMEKDAIDIAGRFTWAASAAALGSVLRAAAKELS